MRGDRDLWVLIPSGSSLPDPDGPGKAVPAPGFNNPKDRRRILGETLPFGITLPPSAGMLQKLGVRGREGGTRGLGTKSPGRGQGGGPRRAARDPGPGAGRPRPAGAPLGTRVRIAPLTTHPVFLAPGGHGEPLFIPGDRIHGGVPGSAARCSSGAGAATSKRFFRPSRVPLPAPLRGAVLALESRSPNGGGDQSRGSPEAIAPNLQKGLERVGGWFFLQTRLLLILSGLLLQPAALPLSAVTSRSWAFSSAADVRVTLRPGKEGCDAGRAAPRGEGGRALASPLPRPLPAGQPAVGTCLRSRSSSVVTEFKRNSPQNIRIQTRGGASACRRANIRRRVLPDSCARAGRGAVSARGRSGAQRGAGGPAAAPRGTPPPGRPAAF